MFTSDFHAELINKNAELFTVNAAGTYRYHSDIKGLMAYPLRDRELVHQPVTWPTSYWQAAHMQTTETFNTSHFTQLIVQRANVTPETTHECSRQALLLEATFASVI